MITATALSTALKKKFGTGASARRRILKQLGLDEDLLGAPTASGGGDKAKAMRVDIENLLGELDLDEKQIGRLLETMDRHASFDEIDESDPNFERVKKIAGDDTGLKKLRAFLMAGGLSEADADEALSIVKSPALDNTGLPRNALAGGYGGELASKLATDSRANGEFAERHPEVARITGDFRRVRSAAGKDFAERHPEIAALGGEGTISLAADAALRQAQGIERHHDGFAKRHPLAARITFT
jgi:hypothetical protein